MERDIYEEDHEAFRDLVKDFVKRHVSNEAIERWDAAGEIDRATMLAAAYHEGGYHTLEEFFGLPAAHDYDH